MRIKGRLWVKSVDETRQGKAVNISRVAAAHRIRSYRKWLSVLYGVEMLNLARRANLERVQEYSSEVNVRQVGLEVGGLRRHERAALMLSMEPDSLASTFATSSTCM